MRSDIEKEFLIRAIDALERELVVVSPDLKILAANQHATKRRGKDIIGKACHDVFYKHSSPCDGCPATKVLESCEAVFWNSGEKVRKNVYCFPLCSDDKIDALVMLDFDFYRMGKLEEDLQLSNAFLKNLILSSVDPVMAADTKGKVLIFSQAASEITGYRVDEALTDLNIRQIYPDDGAREIMKKLRSDDYGGKGKLKSYLVDIVQKNGAIVPILLNAAIVYEGDREEATIGFFHDMREKMKMKHELEKTQIQLLQSEKMASLGKLAAGVAHQINNPLGSITLFTKLVLEEYDLEEGAREDLNRILKDVERCRDTVKELLLFTRQTRHLMRPHDINRALSRTLFLLENQATFQNINISKELDASLLPVECDIQQINHVFMNIILNAAQAMEGAGELTLKTGPGTREGHIRIEISDTGPGIPEEVLPHIFEPFYTTKEEGKGTGLGLSIVYGIVEDHNGRITAANKPGQGTVFEIELPYAGPNNGGIDSGSED